MVAETVEIKAEMVAEDTTVDTAVDAPVDVSKKRKRNQVRPTKTPLELRSQDLPDLFSMKKKINAASADVLHKFHIPKTLRKSLRSIVSRTAVIEDPVVLAEIVDVYTQIVDQEAIRYMAKCLLYYEKHHNFVYKSRDQQLIERALAKSKGITFEKLKDVYERYNIQQVEDTQKYYNTFQRTGVDPEPKTKRPAKAAKSTRCLPYNLFIKDSWLHRREEFNLISKTSSIADVMRKLSTEWKEQPELKIKYKEMADELNMAADALVHEVCPTAVSATETIETAV